MRSKLAAILSVSYSLQSHDWAPDLREFTPLAKPPKPKKNNGFARNRRKAMKKRKRR